MNVTEEELELALEQTFPALNLGDDVDDVEHADNVEDFLMHFGVKGMKWGVRNEDGGGDRGPGLSTKQKVVIGGAVVVGVAITGAILVKSGKIDISAAKATIDKGKSFVDKARSPQAKAAFAAAAAAKRVVDEKPANSQPTSKYEFLTDEQAAARDARRARDEAANYQSPRVVASPPPRKYKEGYYEPEEYSARRDARVREQARSYWTSPAGKTMAKNLNMDWSDIQKKLDDPDYRWEL